MNAVMSETEKGTRKVWVVMVEWDGQKPPSSWYRRVQEIAGRDGTSAGPVRGNMDRSVGPLARRMDEGQEGVVFQEGCIVCPSESTARYLASYARHTVGYDLERKGGRRPTVAIGEWNMSRDIRIGADMQSLIDRVEAGIGKRGRKPEPANWVVTCLECLHVSGIKASRALTCPNCAGLRIHARKGIPTDYRDDPSVPVFDMWLRTRFGGAHFEPALATAVGHVDPPALDEVEIFSAKESEVVDALRDSNLPATLERIPREDAFDVLDAILAGRAHYGADVRIKSRVAVVTKFFQTFASTGQIPQGVSLAELQPDFLDTALLLGDEVALALQLQYGDHTL